MVAFGIPLGVVLPTEAVSVVFIALWLAVGMDDPTDAEPPFWGFCVPPTQPISIKATAIKHRMRVFMDEC